jgi:type I restriction enzyme S subunit
MPKNWKTYKLSEVIQIIGGGTPKTSIPEFWNGSIPWLSVKDFQGEQKFVFQTEKTITEEGLKKSSTKILSKGAIIISARGTVGELAVLEKEMTFNQSCYGILPNDKTDNNYLYYLLKQKIRELQGLSYGSVFDTITTKTFDGLDVKLPPLPEQTQIANILSVIDDKIENNLAINKTLEDMAMALYKHWFVDFGPFQEGEFVDSELGLIPKGWEVMKLEDVSTLVVGGDKPKNHSKQSDEKHSIPIYSNGITNEGLYGYTDKARIHRESITISARGTIGYVCLRMQPYLPIVRLIAVVPKQEYVSSKYLFLWLKNSNIQGNGTTQQQLTVPDFKGTGVLIPNIKLVNDYTEIADLVYEEIVLNKKEIKSLTKLRDTLLPKLISGKVRLKEFREGIDAEMNSA